MQKKPTKPRKPSLGTKRNGTVRELHGMSGTRTYQSWMSMRTRCEDPGCRAYSWYGGRGIRVCERWGNFSAFLEDMGERPMGMSLDRINPYGNYEPGNCRWATRKEQAQNKRETLNSMARKCGLTPNAVRHRLARGMSIVDALTTPPKHHNPIHPTLREIADALGVAYQRVSYRINRQHSLTWEEATEIVKQGNARATTDSTHGKD